MMRSTLIVAGALTLMAQGAMADLTIATWNIQRLGHNNQKSFEQLAVIGGKTDFLAVQEVMTPEAVTKLEKALEANTGQSWSSLESETAGRGRYRESYAFLWRDSKVAYQDGAVTFLDRHDTYEREPFSAQFNELATNRQFVAATVHILFGKSAAERTPEIRHLAEYWQWLGEVYPGNENIFLMGDFNMPPSDPSWRELKAYAKPLVTKGASTLSSRDKKFANLYDNVFVSVAGGPMVSQAFVLNYPRLIGWSHKKSRKHISDHAPIIVQVSLTERSATPGLITHTQPPGPGNHKAIPIASSGATEKVLAFRGNKNSMVLHREDCPSYNAVGLRNRVHFDTAESAIAAGYHLAGNCH